MRRRPWCRRAPCDDDEFHQVEHSHVERQDYAPIHDEKSSLYTAYLDDHPGIFKTRLAPSARFCQSSGSYSAYSPAPDNSPGYPAEFTGTSPISRALVTRISMTSFGQYEVGRRVKPHLLDRLLSVLWVSGCVGFDDGEALRGGLCRSWPAVLLPTRVGHKLPATSRKTD